MPHKGHSSAATAEGSSTLRYTSVGEMAPVAELLDVDVAPSTSLYGSAVATAMYRFVSSEHQQQCRHVKKSMSIVRNDQQCYATHAGQAEHALAGRDS